MNTAKNPAAARLARAEGEVASALIALRRALVEGLCTIEPRRTVAECERRRRELEGELEQAAADAEARAQQLVAEAAHKLVAGVETALVEMRARLVVPAAAAAYSPDCPARLH